MPLREVLKQKMPPKTACRYRETSPAGGQCPGDGTAGPDQEVVVIVIDALGAREVYRGVHPGESSITRHVRGYGDNARIQVYVDNFKTRRLAFRIN